MFKPASSSAERSQGRCTFPFFLSIPGSSFQCRQNTVRRERVGGCIRHVTRRPRERRADGPFPWLHVLAIVRLEGERMAFGDLQKVREVGTEMLSVSRFLPRLRRPGASSPAG